MRLMPWLDIEQTAVMLLGLVLTKILRDELLKFSQWAQSLLQSPSRP